MPYSYRSRRPIRSISAPYHTQPCPNTGAVITSFALLPHATAGRDQCHSKRSTSYTKLSHFKRSRHCSGLCVESNHEYFSTGIPRHRKDSWGARRHTDIASSLVQTIRISRGLMSVGGAEPSKYIVQQRLLKCVFHNHPSSYVAS